MSILLKKQQQQQQKKKSAGNGYRYIYRYTNIL